MEFEDWVRVRTDTRRMQVQHVTVRVPAFSIPGTSITKDKNTTELARPMHFDNKTLFVQVLRVKLKNATLKTWASLLGLLERWKATPSTIALARSVWKEFIRAVRRMVGGYSVQPV